MRILLLVIVALFSASTAHAAKARLSAMQGARFLVDPQTVFINPAHVNSLGQYFTMEMGDTSTTPSAPKAEGGMLMNGLGGKAGFYVGHMSEMQFRLRADQSFFNEQNPVEVFYGLGNLGGSIFYSKSDKGTTSEAQTNAGFRLGFDTDLFEVYATVEAYSRSKRSAGIRYRSNPAVNAGAEMQLGNYYIFADVKYIKSQQDIGGQPNVDYDNKTGEIGIQDNKTLSVPGRTFYYGISAKYDMYEKRINTIYNFYLPLVAGIEYEFAEWVKARGSIQQNVFFGHTMDQTAATPLNRKDTRANDTTAAAGLGFNWKEFEFDGVLSAGTSGTLSSTNFLTNASATYNF